MLFFADVIDPKAPMSLGALVAIIGVLVTWIIAGITIRKFIVDERKRRRDDDQHLQQLIERVCKSFTESDAYQLRRDRAMKSVAKDVSDEQFAIRARSFVDSEVDKERREQTERRLTAMEKSIADLRADFKVAAASIAKEVAREMRYQAGVPESRQ